MKEIGFIADFYSVELPGGGESNDFNLIKALGESHEVTCYKSNEVTTAMLEDKETVIVSNFVLLPAEIKNYLIQNKKYIIYEHDHKYVSTRDPSRFKNFIIPQENLINKKFYENSYATVVLSEICKDVLSHNLPQVNVINIGCSLWSKETFEFLRELVEVEKTKANTCVMYSTNPTKNFHATLEFCEKKDLKVDAIKTTGHREFLASMAPYTSFLFIPAVLETFSRICAEAKMMNVAVMTNKKLIGFFSEEYSNLNGIDLINKLEEKNQEAIETFVSLL